MDSKQGRREPGRAPWKPSFWAPPKIFFDLGIIKIMYAGVQRINDAFHIVDKVENVCVNKYIFDLIIIVECVVYAL